MFSIIDKWHLSCLGNYIAANPCDNLLRLIKCGQVTAMQSHCRLLSNGITFLSHQRSPMNRQWGRVGDGFVCVRVCILCQLVSVKSNLHLRCTAHKHSSTSTSYDTFSTYICLVCSSSVSLDKLRTCVCSHDKLNFENYRLFDVNAAHSHTHTRPCPTTNANKKLQFSVITRFQSLSSRSSHNEWVNSY